MEEEGRKRKERVGRKGKDFPPSLLKLRSATGAGVREGDNETGKSNGKEGICLVLDRALVTPCPFTEKVSIKNLNGALCDRTEHETLAREISNLTELNRGKQFEAYSLMHACHYRTRTW